MTNLSQQMDEAMRQSQTEPGNQAETLAHFKRLAQQRELRLLQLQQEVNDLCLHHGMATRYPAPFEPNSQPTQAGPDAMHSGNGAAPITDAGLFEKEYESEFASGLRYRMLFDAMDQGFCVIEKMEGEVGQPPDFRFLEVNPAFAAHTGLNDVGRGGSDIKTMRLAFPHEPEQWFQTFDTVCRNGEPARFEHELASQGRWLEIHAFQVAHVLPHRIAVLFKDITARHKAEHALRESKAFSRSILDSSPDCIKVLDLKGYELSVQSRQELSGLEDIPPGLSTSWLDFWDGKHRVAAQAAVDSAVAGVMGTFVGFFRTPDGESSWWEVLISPILDAEGQPARLLTVSRNVTQRQGADAALRESQALCRLALDAAEVGTFHVDPSTNTLTADARFRSIFGIASEEINYEQAFSIVHSEDRAGQRHAVAAATRLDAPDAYAAEYRVVHPDGRIHWVFAKGCAHFGILEGELQRKLMSFDGTVVDITERKLAEEVLSQRVAQFEILLNAAPIGVHLIDADFRIRHVNPAGLSAFGNIPDLIGRDFAEVIHLLWPKEWADTAIQQFRHTLETGESLVVPEMIEKRADRQTLDYYEWQIDRIPLPDGGYGVVCYFRDISERVLTQMKIRDSEERYRNLFNSMDEGFAILDIIFDKDEQAVDFRCVEVNPAFEKQTGLSNPIGKRASKTSPYDQAESIDVYAKVLMTGEPIRFIKESKTLNRWFEVYASRLDGPQSRRIAVIFNNITERKLAEITLLESEERYRNLFNAMDEGFCIIEMIFNEHEKPVDYRFLEVNPSFEKQSGMHDVVGKRVHELLPNLEENWFSTYGKVALTGEPVRFVNEVKGLNRWLDIYAARLGEPANQQVAVIFSNITERRKAEETLRQSEERFRALFNSGSVAIYSCDTAGKILEINRAAMDLWGREPKPGETDEQFRGALKFSNPDGSALPYAKTSLTRVLKGEIPSVHNKEGVNERPDGSHNTVISNIVPLKNGHGEITGAINCFYDITERSRLQGETLKQAQTLSELDRRKDEFLAMLSHELRNPLAAIFNAVQLLRLQKDEEPLLQQGRSIIERQVGHLKHLVDDLLEVSRITTGNVRLRTDQITISGVVERAVETAQPLITERRHVFEVKLPPEPIFMQADAARLEQVLVNLLTNAAKYTDEGGHIWLSVGVEDPDVVLRVRDTGIGIAPELLPRIFELFTQGERSLDRSQGGLGIGLCLVQQLVELHGGTIEAHSVLGQGSEFVVRLPLIQTAMPASTPPALVADQPSPEKAAGCRVLVVDDNVDAAQSLGMLLEMTGHEIRLAYDGPTALQAAIDYQPDVVLLDIGLPGLDGYQVAQRIRQQDKLKGIVLVALTGYGQESDQQHSQEAGFNHHLVKPADFNEIENILATVMQKAT